MGSRPEINMFIQQMTEANTQRLSKLNEKKAVFNDAFGPFAFCNRKMVNQSEQQEAQLKAYTELIHYVTKVIIKIDGNNKFQGFYWLKRRKI